MTKNTIKVFGSRCSPDGCVERKIFKNLRRCERWIGVLPGVAQGITFTRGSDVLYKYAYNKGSRKSFKHISTPQDYERWWHWYDICHGKA